MSSLKYKTAGVDVLADVLGTLRLRSRVFCRSEMSAPWSMTLGAGDFAHFHVIERGGAWLRFASEQEATALAAGDLVVVPHGDEHTLSTSPRARRVPLDALPREQVGAHYVVRSGGGGAATEMLCGAFEFDDVRGNPVLDALPRLLHVRGVGTRLGSLLALLAAEAREPREGSAAIVTKLTDVVFVHALRAWLDEQRPGGGGWLGALRDPQIGAALAAMHRSPERDWSVADLADEASMSRSHFAARFRELVDRSPLAYLADLRMLLAGRLARDERLSLREMADRVGFRSEAAFSRAFKRHFGAPPTAYRAVRPEPAAEQVTRPMRRHATTR